MKTDIIASTKFPEFFREEFPTLIQFVESYYEYIEEYTFNGKIDIVKDIDLVDKLDDEHREIFLSHYKAQFAIGVPTFDNMSDVEFLRNAAQVYSSRGTERCLKFLFRAAYGEEIEVFFPKFNMLRTSESSWSQDYHFQLHRLNSTEHFEIVEGDIVSWSNTWGSFQITVKRVENISDLDSMVYFQTLSKLQVESSSIGDQKVRIIRSGVQVYSGEIKKSLSNLSVSVPGKFWQKGSVFRIPGTQKDSIARVEEIGENGAISSVDIIQYGYPHEEGIALVLSPFKNKPPSANIDITSEYVLVSSNPNVYILSHSVSIQDSMDGFDESLLGESSKQTYYLTDYYEPSPGYYGSVAFTKTLINDKVENFESGETVTMEDWLSSRATFILEFDYIIRGVGSFAGASGLISNPNSVLQDSKYFQCFSYVITTEKTYKETEEVIKFNHPSGTKMFVETRRENILKFGTNVNRSSSYENLYMTDELSIEDEELTLDK